MKNLHKSRHSHLTQKGQTDGTDFRLKITIHRGTDQIGGSVTEYEYDGWKLFVDYGQQLPGAAESGPLHIEGLTQGDLSKSALLITHYHGDHIGCITDLSESLPIYMSHLGRNIQLIASKHLASVNDKHKRMAERLATVNTFTPGKELTFGPFTIMPIVMDHSAFDASAFKITADDNSVFHTGDFRTHGFRSKTLPKVIEKYIGKVSYVVCEGTNIKRPDKTNLTEHELQKKFIEQFQAHKNNIVYVSSTNIDRLFALYHAAQKAGRPFIVSDYQKRIMDSVIDRDPIWGKSRMYKYEEYPPLALGIGKDNEFLVNDKFQYLLNTKGCVIIAQANTRFDHLIGRLSGDIQKYLSMWKGYVDKDGVAYNAQLALSLGSNYLYMHTSGHCDMNSIRDLFTWLNPKAIIPIHTDNPEAFALEFCDDWPVIRLYDGETFATISSRKVDSCSLGIITVEQYKETENILSREDDAPCYGIRNAHIGNFRTMDDAQFVVSHVTYRPQYLLGYELEEAEDMWPYRMKILDSETNLLAEYLHGDHAPNEARFQEPCRFAIGEKVLALIYGGYNVIMPVKILGPISMDFIRDNYEQEPESDRFYKTFEDYKSDISSLWNDWDWDEVAVHPYVKVVGPSQMGDTEIVPRVYLFPYRDFTFSDQ